MTRPLLIIGGGGHDKVLIASLKRAGRSVVGVFDTDQTLQKKNILGVPVFVSDQIFEEYDVTGMDLVLGIGFVGANNYRRRIFQKYKRQGYQFASVVDPSSVISSDVKIEEGVQVLAGCVVQPGALIGSNTIINTGASIDHDCHIGAHAHIAPGAVICGGVTLGNNGFVGSGATVIQSVSIGQGSVVAAGAVVIRDVPENSCVAGVPAEQILKHKKIADN